MPLRHTFIADCETPVSAYLKLRGDGPVVPARVGRAGPAVGRWSFLGFRPRARDQAGRAASTRTRTRRVDEELARYRIAPLEGLPPFAGGAVGMFGYDLVAQRRADRRRAEPGRRPACRSWRVMVTDVLLAFDHLRHEVTVLANVVAEGDVERAYEEAAAAIADVRERLRGPVPRASARQARAARVRLQHRRRTATPRRSSARRSTSAPATSTRWSRASAGAPTARSTRSRSTAACARSTRARTCTSSTSRTSRSRAPRRSRS